MIDQTIHSYVTGVYDAATPLADESMSVRSSTFAAQAAVAMSEEGPK